VNPDIGIATKTFGGSTRDVLAFPAMALGFHHGFAFSDKTQCTAIATALESHKILLLEPGILTGISFLNPESEHTKTILFANAKFAQVWRADPVTNRFCLAST
jgi:hypothetical protein